MIPVILFILLMLVEAFAASSKRKLTIHLIPHSHCDGGWLETFEGYFIAQVDRILTQAIKELVKKPHRRFIWAEVSFWMRWYETQTEEMKDVVATLIRNKQLEFVGGGWVQNDEANPDFATILGQITEGDEYLANMFGQRPRIAWQIDPFGHSAAFAAIAAAAGYDALVINRIDHTVKSALKERASMEFVWSPYADFTPESTIAPSVEKIYRHGNGYSAHYGNASILTHVLHTHYSAPRGYDFENSEGVLITDNNVHFRAVMLIQELLGRSKSYRTSHLLVTFGDDFKFQNAEKQFTNMDRLMAYINSRNGLPGAGYTDSPSAEQVVSEFDGVVLRYSTLSEYFDFMRSEVVTNPVTGSSSTTSSFVPLPHLTPVGLLDGGVDFFPYADNANSFWTGYYTSRSLLKSLTHRSSVLMRSAEALVALARPSGDVWHATASAAISSQFSPAKFTERTGGHETAKSYDAGNSRYLMENALSNETSDVDPRAYRALLSDVLENQKDAHGDLTPVQKSAISSMPYATYSWLEQQQRMEQLRLDSALATHHDAITGTAREHVVKDYFARLSNGYDHMNEIIADTASLLLGGLPKALHNREILSVLDGDPKSSSFKEAKNQNNLNLSPAPLTHIPHVLPVLDRLVLPVRPSASKEGSEFAETLDSLNSVDSVFAGSVEAAESVPGVPIVVYNPLSWPVRRAVSVVVDLPYASGKDSVDSSTSDCRDWQYPFAAVVDENGRFLKSSWSSFVTDFEATQKVEKYLFSNGFVRNDRPPLVPRLNRVLIQNSNNNSSDFSNGALRGVDQSSSSIPNRFLLSSENVCMQLERTGTIEGLGHSGQSSSKKSKLLHTPAEESTLGHYKPQYDQEEFAALGWTVADASSAGRATLRLQPASNSLFNRRRNSLREAGGVTSTGGSGKKVLDEKSYNLGEAPVRSRAPSTGNAADSPSHSSLSFMDGFVRHEIQFLVDLEPLSLSTFFAVAAWEVTDKESTPPQNVESTITCGKIPSILESVAATEEPTSILSPNIHIFAPSELREDFTSNLPLSAADLAELKKQDSAAVLEELLVEASKSPDSVADSKSNPIRVEEEAEASMKQNPDDLARAIAFMQNLCSSAGPQYAQEQFEKLTKKGTVPLEILKGSLLTDEDAPLSLLEVVDPSPSPSPLPSSSPSRTPVLAEKDKADDDDVDDSGAVDDPEEARLRAELLALKQALQQRRKKNAQASEGPENAAKATYTVDELKRIEKEVEEQSDDNDENSSIGRKLASSAESTKLSTSGHRLSVQPLFTEDPSSMNSAASFNGQIVLENACLRVFLDPASGLVTDVTHKFGVEVVDNFDFWSKMDPLALLEPDVSKSNARALLDSKHPASNLDAEEDTDDSADDDNDEKDDDLLVEEVEPNSLFARTYGAAHDVYGYSNINPLTRLHESNIPVKMGLSQYRSSKSGAYIFRPEGESENLLDKAVPSVSVSRGRLEQRVSASLSELFTYSTILHDSLGFSDVLAALERTRGAQEESYVLPTGEVSQRGIKRIFETIGRARAHRWHQMCLDPLVSDGSLEFLLSAQAGDNKEVVLSLETGINVLEGNGSSSEHYSPNLRDNIGSGTLPRPLRPNIIDTADFSSDTLSSHNKQGSEKNRIAEVCSSSEFDNAVPTGFWTSDSLGMLRRKPAVPEVNPAARSQFFYPFGSFLRVSGPLNSFIDADSAGVRTAQAEESARKRQKGWLTLHVDQPMGAAVLSKAVTPQDPREVSQNSAFSGRTQWSRGIGSPFSRSFLSHTNPHTLRYSGNIPFSADKRSSRSLADAAPPLLVNSPPVEFGQVNGSRIEVIVHRRLMQDDGRGLATPMDDKPATVARFMLRFGTADCASPASLSLDSADSPVDEDVTTPSTTPLLLRDPRRKGFLHRDWVWTPFTSHLAFTQKQVVLSADLDVFTDFLSSQKSKVNTQKRVVPPFDIFAHPSGQLHDKNGNGIPSVCYNFALSEEPIPRALWLSRYSSSFLGLAAPVTSTESARHLRSTQRSRFENPGLVLAPPVVADGPVAGSSSLPPWLYIMQLQPHNAATNIVVLRLRNVGGPSVHFDIVRAVEGASGLQRSNSQTALLETPQFFRIEGLRAASLTISRTIDEYYSSIESTRALLPSRTAKYTARFTVGRPVMRVGLPEILHVPAAEYMNPFASLMRDADLPHADVFESSIRGDVSSGSQNTNEEGVFLSDAAMDKSGAKAPVPMRNPPVAPPSPSPAAATPTAAPAKPSENRRRSNGGDSSKDGAAVLQSLKSKYGLDLTDSELPAASETAEPTPSKKSKKKNKNSSEKTSPDLDLKEDDASTFTISAEKAKKTNPSLQPSPKKGTYNAEEAAEVSKAFQFAEDYGFDVPGTVGFSHSLAVAVKSGLDVPQSMLKYLLDEDKSSVEKYLEGVSEKSPDSKTKQKEKKKNSSTSSAELASVESARKLSEKSLTSSLTKVLINSRGVYMPPERKSYSYEAAPIGLLLPSRSVSTFELTLSPVVAPEIERLLAELVAASLPPIDRRVPNGVSGPAGAGIPTPVTQIEEIQRQIDSLAARGAFNNVGEDQLVPQALRPMIIAQVLSSSYSVEKKMALVQQLSSNGKISQSVLDDLASVTSLSFLSTGQKPSSTSEPRDYNGLKPLNKPLLTEDDEDGKLKPAFVTPASTSDKDPLMTEEEIERNTTPKKLALSNYSLITKYFILLGSFSVLSFAFLILYRKKAARFLRKHSSTSHRAEAPVEASNSTTFAIDTTRHRFESSKVV